MGLGYRVALDPEDGGPQRDQQSGKSGFRRRQGAPTPQEYFFSNLTERLLYEAELEWPAKTPLHLRALQPFFAPQHFTYQFLRPIDGNRVANFKNTR